MTKMTGVALVFTILFSLFKLLVTCLPNDAVKWITKKFELHSELNEPDVSASYNHNLLEGSDKARVVQAFNEAQFLKRQHIFPGNEQLFLQPEHANTPIVINTKKGKKDVKLIVFPYSDHLDVVKQYKKKLFAYSLYSESLQNVFVSNNQAV